MSKRAHEHARKAAPSSSDFLPLAQDASHSETFWTGDPRFASYPSLGSAPSEMFPDDTVVATRLPHHRIVSEHDYLAVLRLAAAARRQEQDHG